MPAAVTAEIFVSTGSNEFSIVHVAHNMMSCIHFGCRCGQCHHSEEERRDAAAQR